MARRIDARIRWGPKVRDASKAGKEVIKARRKPPPRYQEDSAPGDGMGKI